MTKLNQYIYCTSYADQIHQICGIIWKAIKKNVVETFSKSRYANNTNQMVRQTETTTTTIWSKFDATRFSVDSFLAFFWCVLGSRRSFVVFFVVVVERMFGFFYYGPHHAYNLERFYKSKCKTLWADCVRPLSHTKPQKPEKKYTI